MDRILQAYLDNVECAGNFDQLRDALTAVAADLGLHSYAYLALSNPEKPLLISTYDERWKMHYLERQYQILDPIVRRALRDPRPFDWGADLVDSSGSVAIGNFFREAADFGICQGHTIPIGRWRSGRAAMTFATDCRSLQYHNCIRHHAEVLQLIAYLFHAEVQRMREPGYTADGVPLSKRQRQCLEWAAKGKTIEEVAQLLGIKRPTAKYHLDCAKAKFGVKTNVQAGIAFKSEDKKKD